MFNWVDILVIMVILLYTIDGYRQGFLKLTADLVGIVASFFIALKFYNIVGVIFVSWGMDINLSKPIGFFALWTISQLIFYFLIALIFHGLPRNLNTNKVNRVLGLIPGAVKGIIIVSIFLMLLIILPFSNKVKTTLNDSLISRELIKGTAKTENRLEAVLGKFNNTLTFFGTVQESDGITKLNFQTSQFSIDSQDEEEMVELVNTERIKNGLPPLIADTLLRNIARSHSMDMLRNGYFSHEDLSGQPPSARLVAANAQFEVMGENLALAPTVDLAHIGLMNSPSHRANILDPEYKKIGIGIMDAGVFGLMVTQEFTN